jgi:outer membrane protein OmpA-like peptidoglycan-associated protein
MRQPHPHNLHNNRRAAVPASPQSIAYRYAVLLVLLLLPAATALSMAPDNMDLVLQFDSGSAALTATAREELSAYMVGVALGRRGKVLVVGHADDKGEPEHNLELSRKRAAAVKRVLVKELGTPAEKVLSVGQGNDVPIAGNDTAKGRARNRRVVVRLVGVAPPRIQREYGSQDPGLVAVDRLLDDADTKLHLGQYDAALADLDRAAELGGEKYSRWHTAYGIAGFLGGQSPDKLRSYFKKALALDPHDRDARDFMGRVDARAAFRQGRIQAYMGRLPSNPIPVTTRSQAYEYLKLFEAHPLAHHTLAQGTIDAWTCHTTENRTVTYYFDTTAILDWAYPEERPERKVETNRLYPLPNGEYRLKGR